MLISFVIRFSVRILFNNEPSKYHEIFIPMVEELDEYFLASIGATWMRVIDGNWIHS